jgi:1-acyl-sn-glycerol-3-phosphate acyltransferase
MGLLALLPRSSWPLTLAVFCIRLVGREHVPERGPALLVCNHLFFVVGLPVGACVQRFVRSLANRHYSQKLALRWLLRAMHVIPAAGKSLPGGIRRLEALPLLGMGKLGMARLTALAARRRTDL